MDAIKSQTFNIRTFSSTNNINQSTTQSYVRQLREAKKITYVGTKRSGTWRIVKDE